MRISDDLLRQTANNFTALRLLLALAVLYTHAWETTFKPVSQIDNLSGLLGSSPPCHGMGLRSQSSEPSETGAHGGVSQSRLPAQGSAPPLSQVA